MFFLVLDEKKRKKPYTPTLYRTVPYTTNPVPYTVIPLKVYFIYSLALKRLPCRRKEAGGRGSTRGQGSGFPKKYNPLLIVLVSKVLAKVIKYQRTCFVLNWPKLA